MQASRVVTVAELAKMPTLLCVQVNFLGFLQEDDARRSSWPKPERLGWHSTAPLRLASNPLRPCLRHLALACYSYTSCYFAF